MVCTSIVHATSGRVAQPLEVFLFAAAGQTERAKTPCNAAILGQKKSSPTLAIRSRIHPLWFCSSGMDIMTSGGWGTGGKSRPKVGTLLEDMVSDVSILAVPGVFLRKV